MILLGNILTVISYIVFWISRFLKSKKNILLIENISKVITILSFIALCNINGIQNNIYSMVRNEVGRHITSKKSKIISFIILLVGLVIIYGLSFKFPSTIVLGICAFLNLVGVIICETKGMRLYGMAGGLFYSAFQLLIKNYAGCVCEIITVGVMIYTYVNVELKSNNGGSYD